MVSPTPCILSSSFASHLPPLPQKNVCPPFGSTIEPSLACAAKSIWYLPSSIAMRVVFLSDLEEASRSRRCVRSMRQRSSFFVDSYRFYG